MDTSGKSSTPSTSFDGSGSARLAQMIKLFGYNKDVDLEFATVLAPPPAIQIKVDGLKITLDSSDCIIAEGLLDRQAKALIPDLDGNLVERDFTIKSTLKKGDRVIVFSIENNQRFVILEKVGG